MEKARILCTFLLQNFSKCIFWYLLVSFGTHILGCKIMYWYLWGVTWIFLGCLEFLFQLTAHDKNNLERKKVAKKVTVLSIRTLW